MNLMIILESNQYYVYSLKLHICENIINTIENRVLRLSNGRGTWNNQGLG